MKAKQRKDLLDQGLEIPALRYHDEVEIFITVEDFVDIMPINDRISIMFRSDDEYNTVLNIPEHGIHLVKSIDLEFENSK